MTIRPAEWRAISSIAPILWLKTPVSLHWTLYNTLQVNEVMIYEERNTRERFWFSLNVSKQLFDFKSCPIIIFFFVISITKK